MGKNRKRSAESESPNNKPQKSTDVLYQKKSRVREEVSLASEGVENEVTESMELERKLKKERKKEVQKPVRGEAVFTKLPDNTSVTPLASKGMKKMVELVTEDDLTTEERRTLERKLKKERKKEERKRLLVAGVCTVSSGASQASKMVKKLVNQETEEELSPEERRILERKLKKERKKVEKKLMREGRVTLKSTEPEKPSGCDLALQYLTSWAKKAKDWKFQKTRQTWLLLHMYDTQKISRDHFTILLDYLEGLRGSARDLTVHKAESLLKEKEKADSEDISVVEVTERARQVIQLLS